MRATYDVSKELLSFLFNFLLCVSVMRVFLLASSELAPIDVVRLEDMEIERKEDRKTR